MFLYITIISLLIFVGVISAAVGFLAQETIRRFEIVRHMVGAAITIAISVFIARLLGFADFYFTAFGLLISLGIYILFINIRRSYPSNDHSAN